MRALHTLCEYLALTAFLAMIACGAIYCGA